MDFAYSDDQQSIVDLAGQLLAEQSTHERQRELETGDGPRFDRDLWAQMAETGLLGVAVPEPQGGAGLGFQEVAAICEQLGKHTAPIPFFETAVLGVLPIAEFGSPAQREAWLPRVVAGEAVLTAALQEDLTEPEKPATAAKRHGESWLITGSKHTATRCPSCDGIDTRAAHRFFERSSRKIDDDSTNGSYALID